MNKPTIINVVSGKGGTGKTLLTAVLADQLGNHNVETLVIDMDIVVRGLTSLLYLHRKRVRHLTEQGKHAVSDFYRSEQIRSIAGEGIEDYSVDMPLGISRYRTFDVVPAVTAIDDMFFDDMIPDSRKEAQAIVRMILDQVPDSYQVVILDNRAGYDEFIVATFLSSDITIVVEEEDPVARVTSNNLIRQLRKDAPKILLYKVVNKVRGISQEDELEQFSSRSIRDIGDLGLIPFDIDVMNSFGSSTFWEDISRTLYRTALVRVWNRLDQSAQLGYELSIRRVSPLGSETLESKVRLISYRYRVIFIYGLIMAASGFILSFVGMDALARLLTQSISSEVVGLLLAIVGTSLSTWSVFRGGRKP